MKSKEWRLYILHSVLVPLWLVHSNRLSDSFRGRSSTCARLLDRVLLQGSSWSKPSNTLGCARRVCARYHSSRALSQTSSTAAPPFCKDRISILIQKRTIPLLPYFRLKKCAVDLRRAGDGEVVTQDCRQPVLSSRENSCDNPSLWTNTTGRVTLSLYLRENSAVTIPRGSIIK